MGESFLEIRYGSAFFFRYCIFCMRFCCLPAQGFNVVSSVGRMAEIVTGKTIPSGSAFYYIVGTLIVILTAAIAFGGIKKYPAIDGAGVAVLYMVVVLLLTYHIEFYRIPASSEVCFAGAFKPDAFFEGVFEQFLHRAQNEA